MRNDVGGQQCLELGNRLQAVHQQIGEHRQLVVADEFGCVVDEQRQRAGLVPPM